MIDEVQRIPDLLSYIQTDLLIEEGNLLYPVGIKSGGTVARDMFYGLKDGLSWQVKRKAQRHSSTGGRRSTHGEEIAVQPWFSV